MTIKPEDARRAIEEYQCESKEGIEEREVPLTARKPTIYPVTAFPGKDDDGEFLVRLEMPLRGRGQLPDRGFVILDGAELEALWEEYQRGKR